VLAVEEPKSRGETDIWIDVNPVNPYRGVDINSGKPARGEPKKMVHIETREYNIPALNNQICRVADLLLNPYPHPVRIFEDGFQWLPEGGIGSKVVVDTVIVEGEQFAQRWVVEINFNIQPDIHGGSVLIYLSHELDLVAPLLDVILVDAYCIDPNHTRLVTQAQGMERCCKV
jgi:hypothetical protein